MALNVSSQMIKLTQREFVTVKDLTPWSEVQATQHDSEIIDESLNDESAFPVSEELNRKLFLW